MSYPGGKVKRVALPQVPTPIFPDDIANKAYVDGAGGGLDVVKSVDESVTNSTTLQDDDELLLPVEANSVYSGILYLFCTYGQDASGPPPAGNLKYSLTIPSGATIDGANGTLTTGGTSRVDLTVNRQPTSSNTVTIIPLILRVVTAGTAGNVQLRWAQELSIATPTVVLQGSIFSLKKSA